ncbi:hypothetical protein O3P69_003219 [Scylla paramamosain]|uniref:Uncharacterized protein n=1 Tax=Scylla paramamosain TaxID=85552 RepID=A0AAW0UKI9_SCYPA
MEMSPRANLATLTAATPDGSGSQPLGRSTARGPNGTWPYLATWDRRYQRQGQRYGAVSASAMLCCTQRQAAGRVFGIVENLPGSVVGSTSQAWGSPGQPRQTDRPLQPQTGQASSLLHPWWHLTFLRC